MVKSKVSMSGGGLKAGDPLPPNIAVLVVNPNHATDPSGGPYHRNCQRCVVAYELNRRGISCEAKPRIIPGPDPVASQWRNLFVGQTWEKVGSTSRDRVANNIVDNMSDWGVGSRAVIYVKWKGKGAHVFSAEMMPDGRVLFVDSQSGHTVDINDCLSMAMPTRTEVSRVDNLKPNMVILDEVVERRR